MTILSEALVTSIRETVATLSTMEQQLKATHQEIQQLGFIARSFVEKDISGATGRGFKEWIAAAARLRDALAPLTTNAGATSPAQQQIAAELPRLAVLRGYLERAPQKMNMVPAAVLKPQHRNEVLANLAQQVKSLQSLEGQLSGIGQSLAQSG